MTNPKTECEAAQLALSTTMDTGLDLPDGVMQHIADCPECSAFENAWNGGIDSILAGPLPPAGIALRERVLSFHQAGANQRSSGKSRRAYLSAVAAALVLGFFAYNLVEIRPAQRGLTKHENPAQQELAALKSDFNNGLVALRDPVGAMQLVFRK